MVTQSTITKTVSITKGVIKMRITHYYKSTSHAAQNMHYDLNNQLGDIYEAYASPSINKVRAFNAIRIDYTHNDCMLLGIECKTVIVPKSLNKLNNKAYMRYIHGSLNVSAASSHFFSTCALFEDVETGQIYIIKETHANTYMCEL